MNSPLVWSRRPSSHKPRSLYGMSTAAPLGAWIAFQDEAGQSMTPPRARSWGRVGHILMLRVRGRGSMAGMVCYRRAEWSRLIYAVRE